MSKTFQQVFFKPGRYHVGGGQFREFSRDDVKRYVDGTREMMKAGYIPPVIYEHAPPGSAEGSPRERKADHVRNGVGWLKDVQLTPEGFAVHSLNITDQDAAKKMESGSIRYTSPELRSEFVSGKGEVFQNVFSHVALTHKPRNIDQTQFAAVATSDALQFSLSDIQGIQMSDDEDQEKKEVADEQQDAKEPEQDEPAAEPENKDGKLSELLALLAQDGYVLPDDTDSSNLVERLTVSAMTKQAAEKPNDDQDGSDDDNQLVEDKPPLQFSLNDAEAGKLTNRLLAKVILEQHRKDKSDLDSAVTKGRITPALRDGLLKCNHAVQFSAEGDYIPAFTLRNVIDMVTNSTPDGAAWIATNQFSLAKEESHPKSDFLSDGILSEERVKKLVDEMEQAAPGYFQKSK